MRAAGAQLERTKPYILILSQRGGIPAGFGSNPISQPVNVINGCDGGG